MENDNVRKRSAPVGYGDFGLTDVQLKAVDMLSSGKYKKQDIAKELDIHRETLRKWEKRDDFKAALMEIAKEKRQRTINYFNSKSYEAAVELWKLCEQTADKRVKKEALSYWLDRCLGKPKDMIQVETKEEKQEDFNIDTALQELKQDSEADNALPFAV